MSGVRFAESSILFMVSLYLVTSFSNSQFTNGQHSPDLVNDRLDALEAKVADLTAQLEQEKILRGNVEAKLEAVLLSSEKAAKPDSCQIERKTSVITGSVNSGRISGDIPSNCGEVPLVTIGYDGLYLIFNKTINEVQIVHCQFPAVNEYKESVIGNVGIVAKTKVHFYVQRKSKIAFTSEVLTFDEEKLNIGGAMNISTGTFTAPVSGVYSFQFSALKDLATGNVFIYLRVGNVNVACSYANSENQQMALSPIAASLHLAAGNKVTLFKDGAGLFDDAITGKFLTQFSGFLVEEDLSTVF